MFTLDGEVAEDEEDEGDGEGGNRQAALWECIRGGRLSETSAGDAAESRQVAGEDRRGTNLGGSLGRNEEDELQRKGDEKEEVWASRAVSNLEH